MAPPHTMFDSSPEASATSERSEQLPSVEEVKMMQATDRESMRSLSSKPSDIETAFSGSQELSEHDQLPSVEDVRLDSPRNGKCRRVVKISFWTALLVIVTVTAVTLAVVLTKDDKLKAKDRDRVLSATRQVLSKHPAAYPELMLTSSEAGTGIDALRAEIAKLA